MSGSVMVDVPDCSRCHGAHPGLPFKPFRLPPSTLDGPLFTHWSLCPDLGEPLLIRLEPPPVAS